MQDDAQRVFTKRQAPGGSLVGEAAALNWLAEAMSDGGIRVARPISVREGHLVEEAIDTCPPTKEAAERIGRALARTHAAGASGWGVAPDGWQGNYIINFSTTPTLRASFASATWGMFFARYRIRHYLRDLHARRFMSLRDENVFEQVAARLDRGEFDVPQPQMVVRRGYEAARLHGDLWKGNLLWDSDPTNETGGALIDPMAYGGHAETDLAMLALFGCPYLETIIAAYNEVSPLADGWRERVGLHQLAPLLHHCVLYGASYVEQTLAVARQYL